MPSFFLMIRRPPRSTLFPSTPLFRSIPERGQQTEVNMILVSGANGNLARAVIEDRKSTRLNSSHGYISYALFFFNDTATTEIYPLSLHAALPIYPRTGTTDRGEHDSCKRREWQPGPGSDRRSEEHTSELQSRLHLVCPLFF